MDIINPLKAKYPIVIRLTALLGIGLVILNFLVFPRFGNSLEFEDVEQIIIENIDIPQTQQIDNTPPPPRPSIPVPSDDEDIAEDLTLDELDFDDFSNLDGPLQEIMQEYHGDPAIEKVFLFIIDFLTLSKGILNFFANSSGVASLPNSLRIYL